MNPTFEQITSILFRLARKEILLRFRKYSCIASTRVVVKILRRYGIEADAMACRAFIYSPNYMAALQAGKQPPTGSAHYVATGEKLAWFEENKAWAVGISADPPYTSEWPGHSGHLVAIVPARNVLIDASIDQVNRPQHGICLPPVFTGITKPEFFLGKDIADFRVNGCALQYKPVLDDQSFRQSPDWLIKDRTRPVIRAITREIDKLL